MNEIDRLPWSERLEAWANRFFFRLRSRIRWQRDGYRESGAHLPTDEKTLRLLARYQPVYEGRFAPQTLADNLQWLELLDSIRDQLAWQPTGPLNVLDVGAKNFYYAPTLVAFWQSFGQPVTLTGIELDAFRVYRDRHSRADYAAWYAKDLATYLAGDALTHQGRYQAISLFYPFVLPSPLIKWGLPLHAFQPGRLLDHIWTLLDPGGLLVVVNQGLSEWAAQQRLYAERNWVPMLSRQQPLPDRPIACISAVCKSRELGLV